MGIWSATSTSAGAAMQRERWHGTLELLVASPTPFAARAPPGDDRDGDGRASTAWSRRCSGAGSLFGIDLTIEHPLAVRALDPGDRDLDRARSASCWPSRSSATAPRGRSGTCSSTRSGSSAASSCRSRCCPDWVRPISWALAPTWGMNAIRESALGGDSAARHPHVRRARGALHRGRRARSPIACSTPRAARATLSLT